MTKTLEELDKKIEHYQSLVEAHRESLNRMEERQIDAMEQLSYLYSERARMVARRTVDVSLTETEIDMLQNTMLLAGVDDREGTMEKLRQARLLLRKDI